MRITLDSTIGVIVDVQERLLPVMDRPEATVTEIARLIRGLRVLQVPLIVTEQYRRGLGPTVNEIEVALSGSGGGEPSAGSGGGGAAGTRSSGSDGGDGGEPSAGSDGSGDGGAPRSDGTGGTLVRLEKATFSCCDDTPFMSALTGLTVQRGASVILAGIEAHVCVLQTTIDLIAHGYRPVVVTDATSSRNPRNMEVAFRRMEQEGAILTTVESILFELTRTSRSPHFKAISGIVK
ncbi:MAG: isochorismatase family protein [Alkalispirochaeta sp.]